MKYFIFTHVVALTMLSGCTYSINMVHSEGTATDVIDEDQKADADVSPQVNLPVKPL